MDFNQKSENVEHKTRMVNGFHVEISILKLRENYRSPSYFLRNYLIA